MIAVIDSGICNIASVITALERVEAPCSIAAEASHVAEASAILLPGVGAFPDGMAALRRRGLIEPIKIHAALGKPVLGICLGMQLLANCSEEFGEHEGLGLIPGRVRLLPSEQGMRVPNIGWCNMRIARNAHLFEGIADMNSFYFVHSYAMHCDDASNSVGTINWGENKITVACQRGNIFGAQFHPEKSQDSGLAFLQNFSKIVI